MLAIDEKWRYMSFTEAVVVNPVVRLERGLTYPFVDMAAILPDSRCVHAVDQRTWSGGGSRFQDGDTLMARITPCLENGKIARYYSDQPLENAHGSTEFIVIRGRTGVTHSEYAYYLTRWEKLRNYAVDQMTGTSGRQRVPVNSLSHISVPVPPLPEQRAIAHILGTLDDKIELNRRMNRTLEAMARALFKSWFVDFDPVRAKMALKQHAAQKNHSPLEGESAGQGRSPQSLRWGDAEAVGPGASRPPTESAFASGSTSSTPPQGGSDWTAERARAYLDNMDEDIIALFPDRLVDSELGEIPEGWEVGYAEDGFEIVMGQSPPGHTYNDTGDGLPFFQGRSDFGFRYPKKRKFCTAPSRIAQPQDTIVSVRAPVGDINMAWEPCCIGRGVAALRPRSGAVSYGYYTIQALQGHMCEYENTGTVFGAINRKQLARLPLLQPTPNVIRGFERIVRPKDQMIRLRTAEIMNLTALRDTLLPKLISGEIRLSDAGKWVELA